MSVTRLRMSVYTGGPGTNPCGYRGITSFGGVKSYVRVFNWVGVGAPNLHVVQETTIFFKTDYPGKSEVLL